ncbi:MAG TPA: class I SAM-dependent methyltransferase, partial [Candidatus Nanoarchaeia archaeon]|nr:class I SAM-dependent methyltransferase [Candidatus Nanoarchaeia archaeon]
YEELHKEEQLEKIALIKKYLKVNASDKLLDVGCGTGLTTEPWECRRYGIDPAPKLLARARQRDKIEYTLAQAESIPYPDSFFDIVISITAIQNFSDIKKGLSEIKRVGKEKFALSFLRKSTQRGIFEILIRKIFKVENVISEKKDLIFFCR